uniref:Uncharacterized protein n=1 Tax=Timema tahoe TaxID=61484 RepID=A0A7R9NX36_9NEOP|nr:unnamed protein product [Timema tahoe]
MTNKMGLEEAESEDSHKMERTNMTDVMEGGFIKKKGGELNTIPEMPCDKVTARMNVREGYSLVHPSKTTTVQRQGDSTEEDRDINSHHLQSKSNSCHSDPELGGFGPQYFQSTMDMLLYDAVLATQAAKEFSPPWRNDACLGFNPCPCQI